MSKTSQSDDNGDSDWFDKDEDEILADLQSRTKADDRYGSGKAESTTEYIYVNTATDEYLKKICLVTSASTSSSKNTGKISTADLRKISQEVPLNVFLSAITHEPDFFLDQITANDALERVLLYIRIMAIVCGLELPGFHEDVLRKFAANAVLLEHFRTIATKLYGKSYKSLWSDEARVDVIIRDMQLLLAQSYQTGVLGTKGVELVHHITKIIATSDTPLMTQRAASAEFAHYLHNILNIEEDKKLKEEQKVTEILPFRQINANDESSYEKERSLFSSDEIYPSLDELQRAQTVEQCFSVNVNRKYNNVADYLRVQKQLLREDFMIPLRKCVCVLKENLNNLSMMGIFHNDVRIVIDGEVLGSKRHEKLFMRTGSSDKLKSTDLYKLKNGTLLCLTTSTELVNLILARVTLTMPHLLKRGLIGIQILCQYNIGNIYNKQLILFESPAFFEPYYNVYNSLSACSIVDFPMKQYIVYGETNVKIPTYLKKDTSYTYHNCKFKPLQPQKLILKKLPLNPSQMAAYNSALTQEFCIIQGPPGTGKTYLSVHLVKTLMDNAPVTPIVLITYTNESLDKFLFKLSAYTDNILRFGSQIRLPEICKYNVNITDSGLVNPLLKRLYYVTNLEYTTKFQRLQTLQMEFDGSDESYQSILSSQRDLRAVIQKLDSIRLMFQYYEARTKGIIAMTSTCAAKTKFLFRLLQSSIVIFEEAAEILESHVIACLTPYTEHIIMIGDEKQLKPYTSTFEHSCSNEMNISLFERLIKQQLQPAVLKTQYRMRPTIADLICPIIYEELHNDPIVETYPLVRQMRQCVYFLTHESPESKPEDEKSVSNNSEVAEIIALAGHLIKNAKYSPADIVILSPYAKQIELIKGKLSTNSELENIKAATVDSFQGMEANIVLLSLVRSNVIGQIGFLQQRNRICVALSRAKHGLYIVGNMKLLSESSEIWRAIKSKLEAQEAIGSMFPFEGKE